MVDDLHDGSRWRARPWVAAALTFGVVALPLALSFLVTLSLGSLISGLPLGPRIVLLAGVAVLVGVVAERGLRRVLPLAALLRMSMLFPDRAPSRFALARRSGTPRELAERARTRPGESADEAATRILGLVTALSAHDRRTRGHSERVRVFTDVLAAELHLGRADRDRLRWAALLHDVGKIEVAAAILNKPAALDEDEWAAVRQHPVRGAALAGPLLEWLGPWGAAIEQHHERHDGLGYPAGLRGDEIALAGRVVAVADVFEVMTAARSYKRPMSVRAARRELARVAGTQLDPACVRAFLGASLPRVLWTVGPLALLVNLPFLRGLAEVGRAVEQASTVAATQAVTTAVAATTAVAVVAAPGAGAAVSHPAPSPPRSAHAQHSTPDGTDSPSAAEPVAAVTTPNPSATGPAATPAPTRTASPAASATSPPGTPSASPSTSPSAGGGGGGGGGDGGILDPLPSAVASVLAPVLPSASPTQGSSSGPGNGRDPAEPVVVGPLVPVLVQPVTFVVTTLETGVTFVCRMDGGSRAGCTSTVTYSGLSKGKHRFEVYAVNAEGRKSDTVKWEFTVL